MTARAALLAGAALLFAAAAAAAPVPTAKPAYEPPTAVVRTQTGQKVLLELAAYCKNVFDKETNDRILAATADGPLAKAAAAIDLSRRAGAYFYLRAKAEESVGVFVMPVKGEKEAFELCAALGFEVAGEDKARSTYTFQPFQLNRWHAFAFLNGVAPVVRFHDKCAYFALHNGESNVLADVGKLIPLAALADDKETALASGRLFLDRYPKDLQKPLFALLDEAQREIAQLQQGPNRGMPKGFPACAQQAVAWCQRNLPAAFLEGDHLSARFTLDPKAADHDIEVALTAKPKTPLAADIQAVAKAKGRFAQLVTPDAVTGVSLTLPGPIAHDLRATAGVFFADLVGMGFANGSPPLLAPLNDPLCSMLNAQVAAGKVDAGGAVYGPDKAGLYTAVVGVGLLDGAATGKAVKAAYADAPKEVTDLIAWDAVKVGDAKAHTMAIADLLPAEVRKPFGEASKLHLLFTKDAVVLAVGPEAVERLGKAAALTPAECVGFTMPIHRGKFPALVSAFGGRDMGIAMAPADGLLPVYRADVFGGDALRVRFHFGLAPFLLGDRR